MQNIDLSRLEDLAEDLQKLGRLFSEERRELMETVGEQIREVVAGQIDASGVHDQNGNVKRWQIVKIGSGGGYAAVRPCGSGERAATGRNSPGAITNYLNNGHRIRFPSGRAKRYRPRIKVPFARAFGFYSASESAAEAIALREAQAFADRIAERLGRG